nr:Dabb family protein [Allomuricauda sp.]
MKTIRKIVLTICCVAFASSISAQSKDGDEALNHVLLIQWAEDHDKKVKEEVINLFEGMPGKIGGLESFSMRKVTKSSGDFHNVLIFRFVSEEALKVYDTHPDHEKVKQLAPQIISGFAEYDYWGS